MKHLHRLFIFLAFVGFCGMFFIAGASDADQITFMQLTYLCIASALAMGIGVGGYLLITEGKDDAI